MKFQVSLKINEGSFEAGFPVSLAIAKVGLPAELEINGKLPPAPQIPQQYQLWQSAYLSIDLASRLTAKKAFVANYSRSQDCDRAAGELVTSINRWFDTESFKPIKERFLLQLKPQDEIRILIQTENTYLQCLPWHLVDWLTPYRQLEIALCHPNYEKEAQKIITLNSQVRILAIVGNNRGIDIDRDRELLQQLPNAQIDFLIEPNRQQITEKLWENSGWDILFFAGHSNSDRDKKLGRIAINQQDSLSTQELKYALERAVANGLKIAIFNSCDGLGLARELASLKIPQVLVMREPVPDRVAQEFLKYFLTSYAGGVSFYLAVKEARAKLQGLEDRYPCATWLPIIVQNPAETAPTWEELYQQPDSSPTATKIQLRSHIALVLTASLLATTVVGGLRWWGKLQTWELRAFDHLSQKLPAETADPRLLIVGADERDISRDRYQYPLSDGVLAELIAKIQQYQPAAIGVDIFRDYPIDYDRSQQVPSLDPHWQQPNVVSICLGDNLDNSVPPPPASPKEQVGFANIYDDTLLTNGQSDRVRRYLLSRNDNPLSQTSLCKTDYSFGWQLAYRYFLHRQIPVTTAGDRWQFGSKIVPRLTQGNGGYQKFDDRGNQLPILLRRTPQIAQQVTVRAILENQKSFDPQWIKDRIILIGVTAKSVPDVHDTAIGEIRGLYLHAHVVSQLISAVEDDRPLIGWLPVWADWLWIGFWSFASGLIVIRQRNYQLKIVTVTGCILVLYAVCALALMEGVWLALIPGGMAIVLTSVGLNIKHLTLNI